MTATKPRKGSPEWEDPRLKLHAPEKIRAAGQAIRRAYSLLDDDDGIFWHALASHLDSAAGIPERTINWDQDEPEFSRALTMAIGVIEMLNRRRVSIADVLEGRLPRDLSGVYWTDTGYTECRPHLTDESWTPGDWDQDQNARLGVVLTGAIACDACTEEAARCHHPEPGHGRG
jgi:hypothetical protein